MTRQDNETFTEVDVGSHIPLIHRVIGQMNLPLELRDEAFSEGLVAITEAGKNFNPERNVPLAHWLAKNIRWRLNTWRYREPINFPILDNYETQRETFISSELLEVFSLMDSLLTEEERHVLLSVALGYTVAETAEAINVLPVQVTRIKQRAQQKLKEAYNVQRKVS